MMFFTMSFTSRLRLQKVREKQNVNKFFSPFFIFYFESRFPYEMENLELGFLRKCLVHFYGPSKVFFDLAILSIFYKNLELFKANKLYVFFVIKY